MPEDHSGTARLALILLFFIFIRCACKNKLWFLQPRCCELLRSAHQNRDAHPTVAFSNSGQNVYYVCVCVCLCVCSHARTNSGVCCVCHVYVCALFVLCVYVLCAVCSVYVRYVYSVCAVYSMCVLCLQCVFILYVVLCAEGLCVCVCRVCTVCILCVCCVCDRENTKRERR